MFPEATVMEHPSQSEQNKKANQVSNDAPLNDLSDEDLAKVTGGVSADVFTEAEAARKKVLDGKTDRRNVTW